MDRPSNARTQTADTKRSTLASLACLRWVVSASLGLAILGSAVPTMASDLGGRDMDRIRFLNSVGKSAEAEKAARTALRSAETKYGRESVQVAEVLDELSVALRRGGKAGGDEALEICQRAIRIKEHAYEPTDPRLATSLHNLGLLWYARKEYSQADSVLHAALAIREARLGSNDPDIAKSLIALGSLEHAQGRYDDALQLLERAVAIDETALRQDDPERSYGLIALASLRYSLGEYAAAIPLLDQAVNLWTTSSTPNRIALATCLHNRGVILNELGDYDHASENLRDALRLREDVLGKDVPLVANTLTVLASALEGVGERSQARDCLERALRILEKTEPGGADAGWVRAKVGWAYLDQDDLTRAKDAFERSLQEQEGAIGPDHPDLWICLRGLAMTSQRQGDWTQAEQYYDRVIRLLRKASGPIHPDLGKTLNEYAEFQLAKGDSLKAFETALEAIGVNQEHLRLTARGVAERQAMTYTSTINTGLDPMLRILSAPVGRESPDLIGRGWDALVRSRALVLDEVAERARMVGGAGEVVEAAKRLEAARVRLANLLVRDASGVQEQNQTLVDRARDDVARAESELAALSLTFRKEQDRASIGFHEVLSALPPKSSLVSYVSYGHGDTRSYVAFVMTADGGPGLVPLGPADRIDRQVERWRELVGRPPVGNTTESKRAEAACTTEGRLLRSLIWDPIDSSLVPSGLVFIVPDGPLHLVNFAALPNRDSGYLVESDRILHYLSAERDLVAARGIPSHGQGLLAIGGAAFDSLEDHTKSAGRPGRTRGSVSRLPDCADFDSVRFEPLPATLQEVKEVVDAWGHSGDVTVLTGTRAGERAVKELIAGKRVAHFATHGFFLTSQCRSSSSGDVVTRGIGGLSSARTPEPPRKVIANPFLLSGLALAGANRRAKAGTGEEDGILTADEIASLDLSGLDWVVLSACDTGVGSIQSGEGVLGLRRAFQSAGVGTLIMSLWAVEDESAREWMRLLYQGRFRGRLETAQAVREADLGVLRSLRSQGRSTHPFYWAPFIAAGDWR